MNIQITMDKGRLVLVVQPVAMYEDMLLDVFLRYDANQIYAEVARNEQGAITRLVLRAGEG
jgi:hypothetical protein